MQNRNIIAAALVAACAALPLAAGAEATAETSAREAPEGKPPGSVVTTDTHRLEEVADGVYFAQYTVPRFNSNAMVVVNEEDVLVVDSHITPATGRTLIAAIGAITDKPITTVVNTHFHYDHAHGNQAFGAVTIIGHEFTRAKMAGAPLRERTYQDWLARTTRTVEGLGARVAGMEEGEQRAGLERYLAGAKAEMAEAEEIRPVAPNVTLQERMTLFRGSREIQVVFCGRAHTGGDVVVFLPKERLVFTGDMMVGGPSWLGDGHVDEWPATLAQLKNAGLRPHPARPRAALPQPRPHRPRGRLLPRPLARRGGGAGGGQEHRPNGGLGGPHQPPRNLGNRTRRRGSASRGPHLRAPSGPRRITTRPRFRDQHRVRAANSNAPARARTRKGAHQHAPKDMQRPAPEFARANSNAPTRIYGKRLSTSSNTSMPQIKCSTPTRSVNSKIVS